MAQRPFVVALVILAVLVAGACVYVQTPAGFHGVVLPLANAFAPGELEVERGRLGLGGSLEAEGLRYSAAELGVEATVRELAVDLSIPSLVFGSMPHLNSLRLHGGDVAVSPRSDSDDEPPPEKQEGLVARLRAVPVSVGEAYVQDLSLKLTRATGETIAVGPLELKITELLSGGTGQVEMSTAAKVEDEAQGVDYSGNVELEAEVQQDHDGRIESLRVTLRSDVRGDQEQQPTRFELDLAGGFDDDEALTGSFDLRAARGGQPLGEVDGKASTAADDQGNETVTASVTLRKITELFLNPLIAPFGRGRVSEAQLEGKLDVTASLPLDISQLPRSARGEVNVARFDYRTLAIAHARASLEATPDILLVELAPARINSGSVSGKLSLDTGGQEQVVDAALQTEALDLGALSKAFHEDVPNAIDGLLTLSASTASRAPPGADLREAANGRITTLLRGGRIEGFNLMGFLANQSGVAAFRAIPLDSFDLAADAKVTHGVAQLDEAEVTAKAAEFLINGSVALMGSLDLTIEAFVGPSLSGALSRVGVELPALGAAERFVGVPVAIRVSGPLASLSYGAATPRTTHRAVDAKDSGVEQLKGAADKVKLQDAADTVKDLFR